MTLNLIISEMYMKTSFTKAMHGVGFWSLFMMTAFIAAGQNATLHPDAHIYGWNGYASTNYENSEHGWYRFGVNGEEQQLWADRFIMTFGTYFNVGYIRNGRVCGYYGNSTGLHYLEYDINGAGGMGGDGTPVNMFEIEVEGEYAYRNMLSGAYNAADDCVYGFATNMDVSKIYLVKARAEDPADISIIRELPAGFTIMASCCFSPKDNCMYGVDLLGDMVRCDVYGNFELLGLGKDLDYGGTPQMAQWESGMTFSPKDNAFIWNRQFTNYTSHLVKIDADTYKWSKISDIKLYHQYTFMDTTDHDGMSDGPVRGECVEIVFDGASTHGSVTYKMPTTLSDGNDAPSVMKWTATCGDITKTGTAGPGEIVKVDYNGIPQGNAIFNFRADAGEARGRTLVTTHWVGNDVPARPENVELVPMTNGKYKLTWTAPDHGAHFGHLDTSRLLYKVFLDDVQINGTTSECEMEVEIPDDQDTKGYYCKVVAMVDDLESEFSFSNQVYVGHGYNLPYYIEPSRDDVDMMTVINVDGDKSRWNFMNEIGAGTCFFTNRDWNNPGDDYLITPPLYLDDPAVMYEISFEVRYHNPQKPGEYYDIWLGSAPTVEGIREKQIIGKTVVEDSKYRQVTYEFQPTAAGRHYIGLHYIGDADQAGVYVRGIRISKTDRPGAVTNVTDDQVKVWSDRNAISVSTHAAMDVNVYAPDGRTVAHETVNGNKCISVAPGVYIVCVGGNTFKINVK